MHPVMIMLIFLFAVLPAYCISKEISIEPLICPLHAPKLVFDLSNRGHCILPAKSSSNYTYFSTTIRMYKNNIGKYESEAYRCYKIKTRVGTYTQFARWNVFTKEEVEHVPVDEAECRSMVVDKKCQEGQLVENNGIYSTSNRANAIWSDGNIWNCCKYVWNEATNCFLIKGKVFQGFSGEMQSSLESVSHCDYATERCALTDLSFMVWKVNQRAKCQWIPFREFHGEMWNDQFLSNDKQVAFTWRAEKPRTWACRNGSHLEEAVETDQGIAISIVKAVKIETPPIRNVRSGNMPNTRNIGPTDITPIRLQALEMRLQFYHRENMMRTVCNQIKTIQDFQLVIAQSQPTKIARQLLKDERIMATLNGGTLIVSGCTPVDHFKLLPMTKPCTEYLPINYTIRSITKKGYLSPLTMIIHENSPPSLDCSLTQQTHIKGKNNTDYLYNGLKGDLEIYTGDVIYHPMHGQGITAIQDFEKIIHGHFDIYTLEELRPPDYFNEMFKSSRKFGRIVEELDHTVHIEPPSEDVEHIIRSVKNFSPFGSWISDFGERTKWIWIYSCCGLITAYVLWMFLVPEVIHRSFHNAALRAYSHVTGPRKRNHHQDIHEDTNALINTITPSITFTENYPLEMTESRRMIKK